MQSRKTLTRRTVTSAFALGALFAGTLIATASARPISSSSPERSLRKDVNALLATGVPGVVVITRRGDRVGQVAGGLADMQTRTPMRADDRFRTGSLTKTYVATVVLQLAAEGKLALEDTVERWLPGLVPNGDRITIQQLLNHSSGLPEFDQDQRVLKPYLAGNLRYHWSPRALVKIALSHKPRFAPGARYSYSNTNYLLVGLIVEAATGHSLGTELTQRIFTPLHLKATSFQTTPGLSGPYAHGYFTIGKPPVADISGLSPYPWAAGAIVASGADTATFYRALLRGKLLHPAQLREMKTTLAEGTKSDLPGSRYGLGLESLRLSCGRAWGHGGNFPGYLAYSLTSDDGNRQAVVLLNEDPSSLPKNVGPRFFKLLDEAYCNAA
jgi:D-alanyl-D-alanine carboxypeptidase